MASSWIWIWCGIVAVGSVSGGLLPFMLRWTHRRLQMALSFVSGVMLGVALFHMLPHAILVARQGGESDHHSLGSIMLAAMIGFLAMFFLERFADFHHHEMPGTSCEHGHEHPKSTESMHVGRITWLGAAAGLTLHSLLEGVALASSVLSAQVLHPGIAAAGFGTFLVIFLHKPFDAMTLTTLFSMGVKRGMPGHVLNIAFALTVPLGAALLLMGIGAADRDTLALALALSAGTFLCIAGSDLLPELQFHRHDRLALSLMLALGVGVAWGISRMESHVSDGAVHQHSPSNHPHSESHP